MKNDLVSQELENIIFFDDLSLNQLNNNDVIFSTNLLGKTSDIQKLFKNNPILSINSLNYAEIFLEFNSIYRVKSNTKFAYNFQIFLGLSNSIIHFG